MGSQQLPSLGPSSQTGGPHGPGKEEPATEEADGELMLQSRGPVSALPWSQSGFRPQVQCPFHDLTQGSGGNSRQKPEHSGQELDICFRTRPISSPGGRRPHSRLEGAEPRRRAGAQVALPGPWAPALSSQVTILGQDGFPDPRAVATGRWPTCLLGVPLPLLPVSQALTLEVIEGSQNRGCSVR